MSSKSSGIGIGGILFWGFIAYSIFGGGDDDADKKKAVEKETDKPAITETVKKHVNDIGDKIDKLVDIDTDNIEEAKDRIVISIDSFVKKLDDEEKDVAKNTEKQKKVTTTEKAKNRTTEKAKNDPYGKYESEDLYGLTEDKW